MDSPYLPPKSEIAVTGPTPAHGFWKAFFWLHVVMIPLVAVGLTAAKDIGPFDYVDLLLFVVIVLALFGLTHGKPLFKQGFWKAFAIAYPAWVLLYEAILPFAFNIPHYGEAATVGPLLAFALAISAVTALALYLYAFRSNPLWSAE